MGGFSCAPRCPAFLTFRDSPALVRQESGGYPVRPVASTPTPTAHSPPLVPPSNAPAPDKLSDVGPLPRTLPPLCPSHTPRPDMHIQDKPGVLLSKEKKKWEGGDQRGRLPAYATPQRGAAIAEAVLKHNSKTRSGPGGLGGSLPDRRRRGSSRRECGCKEKKERKQTRQTRDGTRTGSPPARAGFWKDDQGDRWGSPAPDKGHDRLAARCAVDSHIHWRSHLSLATCLQLVAGSLSYHRHTDTGASIFLLA